MQSWKKPTPEQIDRVLALIVRKEHYRYFFDKLENPEWIEPLWEKGFFKNPPKIYKKDNSIFFPTWPEARYLARMAEHKPELVCDIIKQMPETDNVQVLWELADAALKMPPQVAATLIDKFKQWTNLQYFDVVLAEKLGSLIEHLVKGGYFEQALSLANNLLDIQESKEDIFKKNGLDTKIKDPQTKIDSLWHYKEILSKNIPALIKAGKLEAYNLLCKLLEKAIKISIELESQEEDFSYIWRPAIEKHPQNIKKDVKNILVDAVRDAGELLIKENLVSLEEIIDHLGSYPYPIFRRIILYLLWRFTDQAKELIPKYLTDYYLFSDPHFTHEYTLLLRKAFRSLSPEEQKQILKWIEDGPEPELLQEKSPEEREGYKRWWLYRELARFNLEDLSEKWQKQYEELVKEFGEPESPDLEITFTEWIGPTSPLTVEELRQKSIDEIVDFLKTWKPSQSMIEEPSPEGLGRALSSVVKEEPEKFTREVEKFIGVNPTYIRHLISGLAEALKEGKTFPWESVLNLCQWAVSQPRDISAKKKKIPFGLDPDWSWTRKEIASLLETAFERNALPFEFRAKVWDILEPLTEDPDPTPEDERKKVGPPELEWPTLAINSVRGTALHAVIRYALWVRKYLEGRQEYKGFDSIPEVKTVLEKHLNYSYDPSLAIRSVYGQWFPWLVYLDREWAKEKVSQIFPVENPDLRDVAWKTYLTFNKAYKEIFDILREQYAYSIEQFEFRSKDQPLKEHERNLAKHLMTFYGLGLIDLNDPLLDKFWEIGGPLRKEALEFVGRTFYYTDKNKISKNTIERFKQLWGKLWKKFQEFPEQYKEEIITFNWWFISRKFEDNWAFSYLPKVFKVADLEIESFAIEEIIKRFTLLVNERPKEVLLCLKYIFDADQQGWHIYFSRENIKIILNKALASTDIEISKEAKRLINYLGSRGYFEFRDLLKK